MSHSFTRTCDYVYENYRYGLYTRQLRNFGFALSQAICCIVVRHCLKLDPGLPFIKKKKKKKASARGIEMSKWLKNTNQISR